MKHHLYRMCCNSSGIVVNSSTLHISCITMISRQIKNYSYHMSDTHRLHYNINAYLNFIFIVPTAALNLSILIVLIKTRALKTMSNIPIAFLAGWDLLTALFSQPLFAIYLLKLARGYVSCPLLISISYVAALIAMTSSFIVVVITTERYLALFHVFFWSGHITPKMLTIPLSLIWVIPLIICVIMFDVMPLAGISIYTLLSILAIVWISFSYFRMFKLIKKIQKRVMTRDTANRTENEMRGKQARLAKFTFAIVFLYLVVNIPYCVSIVLISTVFQKSYYVDPAKWYLATWLMLNSFLNPIVYAWQSPHIGRELLNLWRVGKISPIRSTSYKDNPEDSRRRTEAV